MKKVFRSLPGKVFLFAGCVLLTAVLILLGADIAFLSEYGYTMPFDEAFREFSESIFRSNEADQIINEWEHHARAKEMPYSNIRIWQMTDGDGKRLCGSGDEEGIDNIPLLKLSYFYEFHPSVLYAGRYFYYDDFEEVYVDFQGQTLSDLGISDPISQEYEVIAYLDTSFPFMDEYRMLYNVLSFLYRTRFAAIGAFFVVLVLTALFVSGLMSVSARNPNTEELMPGPLNKVPLELVIVMAVVPSILICSLIFSVANNMLLIFLGLYILFVLSMFYGLCMGIAARVKQHALFSNTVIYLILKLTWTGLKTVFQSLRFVPGIWRTVLIVVLITCIEIIVLLATFWDMERYLVFWIIERVLVIPFGLWIAVGTNKLIIAGEKISDGDFDYKVDTKGMVGKYKRHGENLNRISEGMNTAVEEQLKSERMKTELITNVSHDLKTPLTSIVNYATLISKEKTENANVEEYSAILIKQSGRLKRLIEDLVEASKASTGNLEVDLKPCDAAVFMNQIDGEYEEKLEAAGLTFVPTVPEEEIMILADGRRMWRVFDNLMNNICKYSQRGTRVYASLERKENNAVIIFKNTSKDPLNISSDELMERFVRGDSSRNTEGNGLGLAIARSLTELQNGNLKLEIDGDLFKAILTFPILIES